MFREDSLVQFRARLRSSVRAVSSPALQARCRGAPSLCTSISALGPMRRSTASSSPPAIQPQRRRRSSICPPPQRDPISICATSRCRVGSPSCAARPDLSTDSRSQTEGNRKRPKASRREGAERMEPLATALGRLPRSGPTSTQAGEFLRLLHRKRTRRRLQTWCRWNANCGAARHPGGED